MTRTPAVMEIAACRFCGGNGAFVEEDGDGYAYVQCVCTASGPLRKGEAEAIAAWNTRTPAEPLVDGEMIEKRAHEIALVSLRWDMNLPLVEAAESLRKAHYNNADGHLSSYMAGRFLDAFMAAREALSAYNPNDRLREALVVAVAALGRVNVRCFDRADSPLKPIGDIAREALTEACKLLGDAAYDAIADAALSHKD